ncbi:uncharacterized protein LOC105648071 isoform X2 [Jatropha curcas]|uniref:uncharacterized protein LOC105648071 isoform X2 n=1 Tax=Jatropha curcas TaxID=180498 RepID=UPI0005FC10FB|nr:uncharacterized protein LOC105648071 isoform X2 [Jatropha curcas]
MVLNIFGMQIVKWDGGGLADAKEDLPGNLNENDFKNHNSKHVSLDISTSRKALLGDDDSLSIRGKEDTLKVTPTRLNVLKLSTDSSSNSPKAKFRQIAEERDQISRSVPSSTCQGFQERFNGLVARKIDWTSLQNICRNWIMNPFNMALFLWISCVALSGAILFLVMTGMLNHALPKKSQRDAWFEVNNQILNALFTLMCLYQHPKRFYHLVLLCRWRPKDVTTLRKIYCKNGTYKPHEWAHMMVVVILLHINCFAQYALCSLNLGYKRSRRPAIGVGICLSVAIAAPAIAGVYSIVSPLGKEYESEFDEEAQNKTLTDDTGHSNRRTSHEKRFSFASKNEQRIIEYAPVWRGGILDIWDNISIAYLSLFCSFCMFGWNMERLGFGNMYVHIATFLLLCIAPFWIFNLAAINIDNETVREALGLTGVVLCLFGLLYGGFWRIQMRKRFNLPANNACCGKPAIADCTQWLFCCWCSLAQEVRTADFYDIVEDKFCRKQTYEVDQPPLSPLPHDGVQFKYNPTSPLQNSPRLSRLGADYSPSPSRFSKDYHSPGRQLPKAEDEYHTTDTDNVMKPPVLPSIQREETTDH